MFAAWRRFLFFFSIFTPVKKVYSIGWRCGKEAAARIYSLSQEFSLQAVTVTNQNTK